MDLIFLKSFFPEIFLSLCIFSQLLFNSKLIHYNKFNFPLINIEILWQCLFILICLLLLFFNQIIESYNTNFFFFFDLNSIILKKILIIFSLLIFIIVWKSYIIQKINFFEFFSLFFLSLLSALLLLNCSDLISTYLIIELQVLCFYILSCFKRTSSFCTEAGLKYFILGSFISSLFLLGSFFIYASLGTLNFYALNLLMSFPFSNNYNIFYYLVILGIFIIICVLLFKLTVAPFHFWAPDVYEGSPLGSTILFSLLPKLSLVTFFIKWLSLFINNLIIIKIILSLIGLFSIFWGAYLAIIQKRFKRFIIYSSISQVGFIITTISLFSFDSYASLYFFLIIYLLSSIILWGNIVSLYSFNKNKFLFFNKQQLMPIFLSDLSFYFNINYIYSLSFLILFFSFAGIPPFSGFLSKFFILYSLILNNNIVIATLLIFLSVISGYYYLRIIKIIFFDKKIYFKTSLQYITVSNYFFNIECLIYSCCLFLLIFLFFSPTYLLLITNLLTFCYILI